MPTLTDWEAAVPKCPRIRVKRQGLTVVNGTRCAVAMRYVGLGNVWVCPRCLHRVKGLMVVESRVDLPAAA